MLLDEVEKAHPEVFDILLQVLDDGRLTDGQGRTVDFRNVILVLTEQPRLAVPGRPDARRSSQARGRAWPLVRARSSPSSSTGSTTSWSSTRSATEELARIVDLQVAALATRLADRRLDARRHRRRPASGWRSTGYDPAYGARPLRRLVQREIGDRLARALLAGEVRDGDEVLVDTAPGFDGVGSGLVVGRAPVVTAG